MIKLVDDLTPEPQPEETEDPEEPEEDNDRSESDNSKSLLWSLLGSNNKQKPWEISKLIELDSTVINFGVFLPGKLLGSTLLVKNISDDDQIVQLVIDSKQEVYNVDEFNKQPWFSPLQDYLPELETTGKSMKDFSNGMVTNSEASYKCWFVENPQTKDLVKHITLKLGPRCEQEFIVVIWAPQASS